MIKKAIFLATLALGCVSGYSQGALIFVNTSTTLVTTNNATATAPGTALLARNYVIGVYGGAAGTLEGNLSLIATFNLVGDGRFSGGTLFNPSVTPAGGNGTFQIRGWSAGFNTYEDALASGNAAVVAGKSALWTQDTYTNEGTDVAGPMIRGAAGFNGLVLTPVPEPTTVAFGLMGLGALALVRRRK